MTSLVGLLTPDQPQPQVAIDPRRRVNTQAPAGGPQAPVRTPTPRPQLPGMPQANQNGGRTFNSFISQQEHQLPEVQGDSASSSFAPGGLNQMATGMGPDLRNPNVPDPTRIQVPPTSTPPGQPPTELPPDVAPPTPVDDATQTPAPTDQNVGQLGPEAIGLGDLGALIERLLAQPSAWGTEQQEAMRASMAQDRADTRRDVGNRIQTDAARRGAFFSTIPGLQNRELESHLARQEVHGDAQLAAHSANMQQQGQQAAIQNAMQFLGQGQQGTQLLAQIGAMLQGAGQQGAPNMNAILQGFMSPGQGPEGMNPAVMQMLGQLFAGQGQGQQPSTTKPRTDLPGAVNPAPITHVGPGSGLA